LEREEEGENGRQRNRVGERGRGREWKTEVALQEQGWSENLQEGRETLFVWRGKGEE
jgi:hypothetical protein